VMRRVCVGVFLDEESTYAVEETPTASPFGPR